MFFLEQSQHFLLCPAETFIIWPPSTFPGFPCATLCLAPHPCTHWTSRRFWDTQGTLQPLGLHTWGSRCPEHPCPGSACGWHLLTSQTSVWMLLLQRGLRDQPLQSWPHFLFSTTECSLLPLLIPPSAAVRMWTPWEQLTVSLFLSLSPTLNIVPGHEWMNEWIKKGMKSNLMNEWAAKLMEWLGKL